MKGSYSGGRKMSLSLLELTPKATLSQIVSVDEQAGDLLASIGLKPSDHKDETLQSVCRQRKWSEAEVLKWIKKNRLSKDNITKDSASKNEDFGEDLSLWCDWLSEEVIERVTSLVQEINANFPKVHKVHGNQYPWLKNMQWHYEQFEENLKMYYAFEKNKFYPLAKKIDGQRGEMLDGTIRELKRCRDIIEEDHVQLRDYINTICEKGHNLTNPPDACATFRIMNKNFKLLFENLEQQFKVEEQTVFPIILKKVDESKK